MSFSLFWIFFCFLFGSLPLSVWMGRIGLKVDIRSLGDGNPGAANVWRAGGYQWGILAIVLDFMKGALPVGMAHHLFYMEGWQLIAAALAPILGHAYSPFLRFRGGKALAVTFGIWAGLTLWLVPTILGIFFGVWMILLTIEGWAVMAGVLTLLLALLILDADTVQLTVWFGMALMLAWKHRTDLSQKPQWRSLFR